jgi:hypothetical protein
MATDRSLVIFLYLRVAFGVAKITVLQSGVRAKAMREAYGLFPSDVASTAKRKSSKGASISARALS